MPIDKSREELWREMQARHDRGREPAEPELALKGGGGGGTYDGMDGRISKLEAYVDVSRDDLREIRSDLKAIIGKFGTLPTKADLATWKWQWMAASFAIFAIIVTGLVGGLAWIASFAK